ncbi:MAG TPA: hypothetical protein VFK00_11945 [Rhodanobacteraceae bacterium]|nr:hypothetical protein [Rhodanobacteraceae bacterium]
MTRAWLPRRFEWLLPPVGVLALAGCLLFGLWGDMHQALLSYLFAFVFFTGLSVGSLAVAMIQPLTGGAWGWYIRPQLLAALRTLPLMAVLVVPILFGMHDLYVWTHADALAHDELLRKQTWWLTSTFFVIRTVGYFVLWLLVWFAFARALRRNARMSVIAAPGAIVYALTTLMAAFDWISSLTPHWHSDTFGMLVATGWMLGAAALAVLCATCSPYEEDRHPPPLLHDLGTLLCMFVLGWSYLAFMQYLTIWVADLPAENAWYIPRTLTTWRWFAWFLIAFGFAIPFAVLLSRRAKRSRAAMGTVAGMLLAANLVYAFWLVVPGFRPGGFSLRWTDVLAVLGIGAPWFCIYLCGLRVTRVPALRPDADEPAPVLRQRVERTDG